jgi:signal-transduction protein with cAMP-binding, CBS, and nucleotidyltransferase domain
VIESKYLKDDIKNIQQLFRIPAFKTFETKDLAKLLRISKIRRYEDGEIIIQEGSTDQWLYFLLSGRIRVSKDGQDICTIDKMGEIFGEMRIIDSLSRSTSVYAEDRVTCLALDTSSKHRMGSDNEADCLMALLYRVACEFISIRLRVSNERLIQTQQELERLRQEVMSNLMVDIS